jgi:hypothetical protein
VFIFGVVIEEWQIVRSWFMPAIVIFIIVFFLLRMLQGAELSNFTSTCVRDRDPFLDSNDPQFYFRSHSHNLPLLYCVFKHRKKNYSAEPIKLRRNRRANKNTKFPFAYMGIARTRTERKNRERERERDEIFI